MLKTLLSWQCIFVHVNKHGCNCGPLELIPTQETTTGYIFSEGQNFCKTGIKKGLWERQIWHLVAKLTVVTVLYTKKSFVPKSHFETTVSTVNCIRARKLHNRKSAPLFSIYTANMNICHIILHRSGYSTTSCWKQFSISLNYLLSYRLLS